ncbi:hypothetical protein RHOFW104T7_00420 [Rhodanobacter thiooxydans]|uniref:DUF883 domain-containing protein n=1 Tax=Rhodanobacter thiooxydans TaxID=416169 RepID=A0A154QE66_9GAMM|nr:hypothetical protein [Rhodanobacter thiooxydans]EIL96390.1 hypothetical protein UUA_18052 [Rhodanobacter thiooxydans LCS2]KZC22498.1 hypothetical protein RHOFW104T7_00420 [Rhodanobacter thiooxydans]MCW0200596.1 hypothetical protein [Rhodanobacter thiooxydans]
MSLFRQMAKVQAAQRRVHAARHALAPPAAALLGRGREHPLTMVGTAAGAGFVLGSLNVHPLRVPGLGALLGDRLAEVAAHAVRLVAELAAVAPVATAAAHAANDEPA